MIETCILLIKQQNSASAFNHLPIIHTLLLFSPSPSQSFNLRNNEGFLPAEYAYSTSLAKEMITVEKEVRDDRRRQYQSQQSQQSRRQEDGEGGWSSGHGNSSSTALPRGLRSKESRGTLMSQESEMGYQSRPSPGMAHGSRTSFSFHQPSSPQPRSQRQYSNGYEARLSPSIAPPATPPTLHIQKPSHSGPFLIDSPTSIKTANSPWRRDILASPISPNSPTPSRIGINRESSTPSTVTPSNADLAGVFFLSFRSAVTGKFSLGHFLLAFSWRIVD